jgi:hypothetical protein
MTDINEEEQVNLLFSVVY